MTLTKTRWLALMIVVAVMAGAGLGALSSGAGDGPSSGGTPRGRERPNVLIIMTDDQPVGLFEAMPETRNRIADEGVTFPNALVTTPLCCPSRASVLTGLYAHNHRVTTNGSTTVRNFDGRRSLATILEEHGYLTAISGKYLNSWARVFEAPHGFDRWAVYGLGAQPEYAEAVFDVDGEEVVVDEYATAFTKRKAIEFLDYFHETDEDAPWFLMVTPHAPHTPATPEPRYRDAPVSDWKPGPAVGEAVDDKPAWVRDNQVGESLEGLRADMMRTLMSVDDMIAAIMDHLERRGEADDTLIFFLSDNGWLFGEHGLSGKRPPYDPSVRVPFLVRWSEGVIGRGEVDDRLVANVDVAPTIYDAAGIDPGFEMDGRSLLGDFEREELLVESFHDPGAPRTPPYTMLWNPRWSFIRYSESGELEYYGRDDPHQLANLYRDGVDGNEPPDEAMMAKRLDRYERCSGASCP